MTDSDLLQAVAELRTRLDAMERGHRERQFPLHYSDFAFMDCPVYVQTNDALVVEAFKDFLRTKVVQRGWEADEARRRTKS